MSKALLDQQESAQKRCPVCCQRSTYWASVGDEDQTLQRAAAATKANDNDDGDDNIDEWWQRGIGRLYWKQSNRVCLFILLLYRVEGCLPAVASVKKKVQVRNFFSSLLCSLPQRLHRARWACTPNSTMVPGTEWRIGKRGQGVAWVGGHNCVCEFSYVAFTETFPTHATRMTHTPSLATVIYSYISLCSCNSKGLRAPQREKMQRHFSSCSPHQHARPSRCMHPRRAISCPLICFMFLHTLEKRRSA